MNAVQSQPRETIPQNNYRGPEGRHIGALVAAALTDAGRQELDYAVRLLPRQGDMHVEPVGLAYFEIYCFYQFTVERQTPRFTAHTNMSATTTRQTRNLHSPARKNAINEPRGAGTLTFTR